MKICITGGAGYIGSFTAENLRREHSLLIIDDFSQGHRDAIKDYPVLEGDFGNETLLKEAFQNFHPDIVVHLAAMAVVETSFLDPQKYYDTNAVKTGILLESMRKFGIQNLIFSSSASVYGMPQNIPISEDAPLLPINPYGESKLIAETLIRTASEDWGLNAVILRIFNVAGASPEVGLGEDHSPETHLIPNLYSAVLGYSPSFPLEGYGEPRSGENVLRDFVHPADVAEAIGRSTAFVPRCGLKIYNVGSGQGRTVKEILGMLEEQTGRPVPVRFEKARPGNPLHLVANITKIQHDLGWAPRFSFNEILNTTLKWMKTHPHGYEKK